MVGVGIPSRIEITVMIRCHGNGFRRDYLCRKYSIQLGEWNALRTGKLDLLTDIYALEAHSPVDTFS